MGQYSAWTGATNCFHCPAGKFQDKAAYHECHECAAGTWTGTAAAQTACITIPTCHPTFLTTINMAAVEELHGWSGDRMGEGFSARVDKLVEANHTSQEHCSRHPGFFDNALFCGVPVPGVAIDGFAPGVHRVSIGCRYNGCYSVEWTKTEPTAGVHIHVGADSAVAPVGGGGPDHLVATPPSEASTEQLADDWQAHSLFVVVDGQTREADVALCEAETRKMYPVAVHGMWV
jgi:hypothetical protein